MKKGDIIKVESFVGDELLNTTVGTIQWITEEDISIENSEIRGSYQVISLSDPSYKFTMIQESQESFQSQVAHLTDEELMASVEAMREGRVAPPPKESKPRTKKTPKTAEDEALQQLYNGLTNEEKEALSKKLGL